MRKYNSNTTLHSHLKTPVNARLISGYILAIFLKEPNQICCFVSTQQTIVIMHQLSTVLKKVLDTKTEHKCLKMHLRFNKLEKISLSLYTIVNLIHVYFTYKFVL